MKRKRFAFPDLYSTGAATKHASHGENRVMSSLRVAILAALVSLLATLSLIEAGQCAPRQKAVHRESAICPSTDFSAFFHDFSEKVIVQKIFTRFPLVYGKVDLLSLPSPGIGYPFRKEKINSYDKIQTLNHDNGLIFHDEKERTVDRPLGGELHFAMKDGLTDDFRDGAMEDFRKASENFVIGRKSKVVTVVLYLNESGFQVYYRFKNERGCWFLIRIDDKST